MKQFVCGIRLLGVSAVLACSLGTALAQEALIRKNLEQRLPPATRIQEITKLPIAGLYEIRANDSDIFYSDAAGNFMLQGNLIETRNMRNLTEDRVEKLTAINFHALPLKDAFTQVRGNGKRKVAVFEDPNCGYCKRFERDLLAVGNVTIHTFLIPILGADSLEKSKNIWCAQDKSKAWLDWMVRDLPVAKSHTASCDTAALDRNLDFSRKHKITGTPMVLFADGSRAPGAINTEQIEKRLAAIP